MHATRRIAHAARLIAVIAAAAALSACDVVVSSLDAKGRAQDQWTRSYPMAAGGHGVRPGPLILGPSLRVQAGYHDIAGRQGRGGGDDGDQASGVSDPPRGVHGKSASCRNIRSEGRPGSEIPAASVN